MQQMIDIFIAAGDCVRCRYVKPNFIVEVRPAGRRYDGVSLFAGPDEVRRLRDALTASLEAADGLDEPDGSRDRRDIVPAEAVAAIDYGPPTSIGEANCPEQVP